MDTKEQVCPWCVFNNNLIEMEFLCQNSDLEKIF